MNLKFWLPALFLAWILFPSSMASAAEECDFKKEVSAIKAIKSSASTSTEDMEKELALRKKALSSIIGCLIISAEKTQGEVEDSPFVSSAQVLRSRLIYELKGNTFFYNEKLKELESMTIDETKGLAKEVLTWKKNQDENMERAYQYSVWAKNQPLLSATEKRLGQLSRFSLRQAFTAKLLDSSHSLVFTAKYFNNEAQNKMERGESPKETWELIGKSLESMLKAYESFLDASRPQN